MSLLLLWTIDHSKEENISVKDMLHVKGLDIPCPRDQPDFCLEGYVQTSRLSRGYY